MSVLTTPFCSKGVHTKLKKLVSKPAKVFFLRYTVVTGNCGDLLFNSTSRKGVAQQRVRKLINRFCKPITSPDIKFVYSTFKIKNLFNVKDPLPDRTRTRIVYKFSCASCT